MKPANYNIIEKLFSYSISYSYSNLKSPGYYVSLFELKLQPRGGGYSLIWPIWGRAAGQGTPFGLYGGWQRVFWVTRDGPKISSVTRDGAKISCVMRDWTSQRDA